MCDVNRRKCYKVGASPPGGDKGSRDQRQIGESWESIAMDEMRRVISMGRKGDTSIKKKWLEAERKSKEEKGRGGVRVCQGRETWGF